MSDDLLTRARAHPFAGGPPMPLGSAISEAGALLRELIAEVERCHKALRYIAGYDVAGMLPHMRSKDVARAALEKTNA